MHKKRKRDLITKLTKKVFFFEFVEPSTLFCLYKSIMFCLYNSYLKLLYSLFDRLLVLFFFISDFVLCFFMCKNVRAFQVFLYLYIFIIDKK